MDGAQGTTAIGQYLYRDEDVVAEFRVDLTTGSRVLEKLYFHGDLGVDDPVAMFRCVGSDCRGDYQWYFYGKDHLNTVEALWDSGTRPVASYAYSAFGLPSAPPSPLQPFTFTGREWMVGDLLDFRRRLYVSSTGRFASEDPLMFAGGLNFYLYSYNNPVNYTDPWGLAIWICTRPARGLPGWHAYLWDDKKQRCCGMSSYLWLGDPMGCQEYGPKRDICRVVPQSGGHEDELINCCKETANAGIMWFPWVNDCYEAIDDCLRKARLPHPGFPVSRLGRRSCERECRR